MYVGVYVCYVIILDEPGGHLLPRLRPIYIHSGKMRDSRVTVVLSIM